MMELSMKHRSMTFTLTVAVAAVASATLTPGKPAPSFSLKLVDGKTTLCTNDVRGKVVVLDFWATWCVPCQAEVPNLQDLHKRYSDDGVVVLGVSVDEEGAVAVSDFMKQKGLTYRMALDPGGKVAAKYDALPVPTLYLLDKKGVIRYSKKAFKSRDVASIEKRIKALLKE